MAINTDENEGTNERERGQKERKRKANDVRPDARGIYVTAHSSAAITFCSGRCHQTIASASPLRVSGTQALIPTPDTCSGGRGAAQAQNKLAKFTQRSLCKALQRCHVHSPLQVVTT